MFYSLYHVCVAPGYSCPFFSVSTSTTADQTVSKRELHENDYFGEEKLMLKGPYESTVKALCETTLYRLAFATMQNNFHSYGKQIGSA
jgi:CRP-like cAMP-binding protein